MREAARVSRPLPGVASILQINPAFFTRNVGEIARRGSLELIRRMDMQDRQICRLMQALRADVAVGSPAGSIFAESVAIALSAHLAQQYSTLERSLELHRGGLSRSRLNRVVEYIHSNLGDDLHLPSLADVAGLNVHHFAKAFKQSVGESPHQFVLRQRIERAKEFLGKSQLSVLEASARTGFVDQSHFSKVFRRFVGVAPSDYRSNS
jgi:AraC family transcriptional regulator